MPRPAKHFYEFGRFSLETTERTLSLDGRPVGLTPKAFDTLLALVERQGEVVSTEDLLDAVWPETHVEEGNVKVAVSALRKAVGDDRQNGNRIIETVPKRGYRFVATVTERWEPAGEAAARTALPVSGETATPGSSPTSGDRRGGAGSSGAGPQVAPLGAPGPPPESRLASRAGRWKVWLAPVAAIGVIAVAGCVWLLVRPLPPPTVSNLQQLTNDGLPKGPLATDGSRVYFSERGSPGQVVLKQMSVNGGHASTMLVRLGDNQFLDVSPDHSSLLLSTQGDEGGPIWLLPLPGGSPRHLGDFVGRDANWSPDGRKIAYCDGNKLMVANEEGREPRAIAAVKGNVYWPRWSPDGTRLRFSEDGPSGVTTRKLLWQVRPDGDDLQRVLPDWNDPPRERDGSWTPDGRYFVFQSSKGGKADIWAIREKSWRFDLRRREPVQITDLPQACNFPLASADGRRVFFVGDLTRGRLERFSPVEKEFVPFLGGISAKQVTYSPDGSWIAYVKYPEDTLWRMRRDLTDQLQLTFSPMRLNGVAWSPDGKQIAINAWTPANPFKNYLVAAAGGEEPRPLQPGHREMEGLPSWSPDGRKIAFGDVPELLGRADKSNAIHILDLSTGKAEALPGSEGFWSPRWSPDGQYITALKDDDPDPHLQPLWLFDLKTGRIRDLRVDHVKHFLWSHDSRYVYYDDELGHGIYRIRIPNGKPELVANTNLILRADKDWFGLTPDDFPLILRDAGSEEIYSVDVDWH